jgi:hypothetical protein
MLTTAQDNIDWRDPKVVESFNLLTPIYIRDGRDPFQESRVSIVKINPDTNGKEVYAQKGGGLSLSKVAILKIASVAGIQTKTKVDYAGEDSIIISAICSYKNFEGEMQVGTGMKEMKRKGVEHALEKAESGAILRAIRQLLALKGVYTLAELQKPFAVPHTVYSPDFSDPEVKKIALQKFAQDQGVLYGGGNEVLPQLASGMDDEVIYEDEETPLAIDQPKPATPTAPVAQEQYPDPPEESAITEPCPKCGVMMIYREGKRKDGTPWTGLFCPKNRKDDPQCDQEPKWGWKPNQTKDMFGGEPNF